MARLELPAQREVERSPSACEQLRRTGRCPLAAPRVRGGRRLRRTDGRGQVPRAGDLQLRRRPQVHGRVSSAGELAPASNHIPRTKVVKGALWRSYCDKGSLTNSDNTDTKSKTFVRAYKRLQELGVIGVWDGLVWIVRTNRTSPDKP